LYRLGFIAGPGFWFGGWCFARRTSTCTWCDRWCDSVFQTLARFADRGSSRRSQEAPGFQNTGGL